MSLDRPAESLRALRAQGQSIWVDHFGRQFVKDELRALIEGSGVTGATSNPTIFQQAVARGEYDLALASRQGRLAEQVFEAFALEDIRAAADLLRPAYDEADRQDGFISLELPPTLALDTSRSIAEGKRLFALAGRPNVMIKVPATGAGIPAIRALTAAGVNVNVTLLFSLDRYREVVDAYLGGLEERLASGRRVESVASVASFFVSRIDTKVDPLLAERLPAAADADEQASIRRLLGKAAIANARLAFDEQVRLLATPRVKTLAARGGRTQRLLWASTGVKNPAYRDTYYVEELIGCGTISTMPLATLAAFADHGRVDGQTVLRDVDQAQGVFDELERLGIDLEAVGGELEREGVEKFIASWHQLIAAVDAKLSLVESRP